MFGTRSQSFFWPNQHTRASTNTNYRRGTVLFSILCFLSQFTQAHAHTTTGRQSMLLVNLLPHSDSPLRRLLILNRTQSGSNFHRKIYRQTRCTSRSDFITIQFTRGSVVILPTEEKAQLYKAGNSRDCARGKPQRLEQAGGTNTFISSMIVYRYN